MNPEKAIEILTKWNEEGFVAVSDDLEKAEKMGIEALEFFQEFKKVTGNNPDAKLPSETEE